MMDDPQLLPILLSQFSHSNNSNHFELLLCNDSFTQRGDDYSDDYVDDDYSDDGPGPAAGRRHGRATAGNETRDAVGNELAMMTFVRFRFVVNVYVVAILCCFGFIGNLTAVVVLRRDKETSSSSDKKTTTTTNWLLQTLAAVDILFLISCLLIYSIRTIHGQRPRSVSHGYALVDPYLPGLASVAHMLTIYTVLLVTLDRYVAVCRPMSRQLRSIRRARLTFVAVVLLSLAFSLPVFLEQQSVVVTTVDACTKRAVNRVETVKTRMRQSALYFILYKTIGHAVFRSLGPLTAIIILNARLIHSLRLLNRRQLPRKAVDRDNLTTMIVTVVSTFIFCQLPDVALRIILSAEHLFPASSSSSAAAGASSGRFQLSASVVSYVKVLSHALLTLNSSVNFLVYCLIGRRFRRIFLELFLRRRRRKTSLPLPTTVISELPVVASVRNNLVAAMNRFEVTEL